MGDLTSPYTKWGGDKLHGRYKIITPVLVNLDKLFPLDPDTSYQVVPDGLDLAGTAQGRLHGRFRAVDNRWLGVVDYEIAYADGNRLVRLVDQVVPFSVLRTQPQHRHNT